MMPDRQVSIATARDLAHALAEYHDMERALRKSPKAIVDDPDKYVVELATGWRRVARRVQRLMTQADLEMNGWQRDAR